jgi:serine protease Do
MHVHVSPELSSMGGLSPGLALAHGRSLSGPDIDMLQKMNAAYERIATSVRPAIVNIQTTSVVKTPAMSSPFGNDPFFRQFFGPFNQVPQEQREHALGSGVILTANGYIITNNHVIEHASDIKVLLPDNRQFTGKLIGTDPQTDIAVLKIDADSLPTASLGDSATVHVGDTVMAFGNPFGLNFTITRGSVSALGRSGLNIERYEDFIQTDAPINPGNSGGALVDMGGQVVGINTAIVSNGGMSGSGGFQGVGFAIPSNTAHHVMESLVKTGKVVRGYLGVRLETLDSNLASQFKVPNLSGALVTQVEAGSPAAQAGLKAGDVIRTYEGRPVDSPDTLRFMVAGTAPDARVSIGVWRNGTMTDLTLKVGELTVNPTARATHGATPAAPTSHGTLRGIQVQDLSDAVRQQLNLGPGVNGVVVTTVAPGTPAAQVVVPGDLILSVNQQPVANAAAFNQVAGSTSGQVLLQLVHQGNAMFVVLTPGGNG